MCLSNIHSLIRHSEFKWQWYSSRRHLIKHCVYTVWQIRVPIILDKLDEDYDAFKDIHHEANSDDDKHYECILMSMTESYVDRVINDPSCSWLYEVGIYIYSWFGHSKEQLSIFICRNKNKSTDISLIFPYI